MAFVTILRDICMGAWEEGCRSLLCPHILEFGASLFVDCNLLFVCIFYFFNNTLVIIPRSSLIE